tara:strand:- start:487 stop:909 length:423 start_codon:yes stop_codon:yes gene_type:complete
MTNCFHLAIPAGNIKKALGFYCDILGCETGNQEEGRWIDINFWGNELTLHETKTKQVRERHDVDMGDVCVPHFGVHLQAKDFEEVKKRIEASEIDYFDNPYRRFIGSKFEQETFFVEDPNGNVLEIKTMSNPEILFEVAS